MPERHGYSRDAAASVGRRYRIDLVELNGATYRLRVGSREEALERIAAAFEANTDIVYADLFTPAGDWSDRIARTPQCGRLVAAPATDAIPRRKTPWP
jgi:hypothetical protein